MSRTAVEFRYHTSISSWPSEALIAELRGSWNGDGRLSAEWSSASMTKETARDGCISFRTTALLDIAEINKTFEWGVVLVEGSDITWAIPTEVKETTSTRQTRVFTFSGQHQKEEYYLTHCRRLGANLRSSTTGQRPGIQFSVWAPNARAVDLVVGEIFDVTDPARLAPVDQIERSKLGGGFISNRGHGIDLQIGPFALSKTSDGVWETELTDPAFADFNVWDHRPYMYRLERDDGSIVYRSDLYSRCQAGFGATQPPLDEPYVGSLGKLEGRLSCSVVVNPDRVVAAFSEVPDVFPERTFVPVDEFWANERRNQAPPNRIEDLIIYELHMGALGFGNDGPGTLMDAIEYLDHLVDLGINAVELLPLSEFGGGAQNWGYSTSHYFAIEYAGGGRDKFKHFVRACHQRGLAVIMDVVYNHYAQEADRAQRAFDSPAPEHDIYYWYEGVPSAYTFARGGYLDNQSTGDAPAYHEEMVRKLFISSAVSLITEFHVDGFRVDQTTSIHSYNKRLSGGEEVSAANLFGAKMLRELGRTLRMIKPDVLLIAEDHSSWDQVTLPVQDGGMGFDARWFAEFYHCLMGDTNDGNTAKLIWSAAAKAYSAHALQMDAFSLRLASTGDRRVVYNESHDEAGNSSGPFLDPDWDTREVGKQYTSTRGIIVASNASPLVGATRLFAEARCRFAYAITIFSAGTPMFLFGEEVGAERRFKYNKVLDNREDYAKLRHSSGASLFAFYAAANQLRRTWPGLRSRNIDVVYSHNTNRVIAFRRWEGPEHYLVIATLSDVAYASGYYLQSSRLWDGVWREIFNSDSYIFGGSNVGNCGSTIRVSKGEVFCNLPANGVLVFQRLSD